MLRVRQCVAANAPSTHASKLRPSIAAARAVPSQRGHAPWPSPSTACTALCALRARHSRGASLAARLLGHARHSQGRLDSGVGRGQHALRSQRARDPARRRCERKNVVRINAFVAHRDHLPAYMKARTKRWEAYTTASTLMVVSGFARPEFLVEVEAMPGTATAPARQPRWRRGSDGRAAVAPAARRRVPCGQGARRRRQGVHKGRRRREPEMIRKRRATRSNIPRCWRRSSRVWRPTPWRFENARRRRECCCSGGR